MARGRKKSATEETEPQPSHSRRSSRASKKVSYSEANEEELEALQTGVLQEDLEPDYEEPKPKRGRGGKRKNSRTGTTTTPRTSRRKKAAPAVKPDEELESIEEAVSETHTEESETYSTADSETQNGTAGDDKDDRTAEDAKLDEPEVVPEPEKEKSPEPEPHEEAEPENGTGNASDSDSEPLQAEQEKEEFVMVNKDEIPDVKEAEETPEHTPEPEKPAEEMQTTEPDSQEDLPDFEEENDDPDALQLDANVDMDDDLNKEKEPEKAIDEPAATKEPETKPKDDEKDRRRDERKRRRSSDEKKDDGKSSPVPKRKSESEREKDRIRAPSPDAGDAAQYVHITNLVRPFTLNQLKDFLKVPGEFDEELFWIDKIKSNCYVKYNDIDSAIKCRKLIHGKKWPSSNPKMLRVMYSSESALERAKTGKVQNIVTREKKRSASRSPRRFGGMRSEQDFERDLKRKPSKSSPQKPQNASSTEESESEVDVSGPGNMLDELFKKTKTQPSLYWLPLTDAEIEARDKAREERKKAREDRRRASEERRKKAKEEKDDKNKAESEKRESDRKSAKSKSRSRSRRRSGSRNGRSRSKSR